MRQTASGILITFEGGEGCGKSTQIRRLAARLTAVGREVLQIREPGGTPIGETIRKLLQHDPSADGMRPECELLLFAASRAQLVHETIRPALEAGAIVLCDRFVDSTTVYQGVARGLPSEAVAAVNQFAAAGIRPDLTLLLDLPATSGIERARRASGDRHDRIEGEDLAFFETVREAYLDLARRETVRFEVVDGSLPVTELEELIWDAFNRRFT